MKQNLLLTRELSLERVIDGFFIRVRQFLINTLYILWIVVNLPQVNFFNKAIVFLPFE